MRGEVRELARIPGLQHLDEGTARIAVPGHFVGEAVGAAGNSCRWRTRRESAPADPLRDQRTATGMKRPDQRRHLADGGFVPGCDDVVQFSAGVAVAAHAGTCRPRRRRTPATVARRSRALRSAVRAQCCGRKWPPLNCSWAEPTCRRRWAGGRCAAGSRIPRGLQQHVLGGALAPPVGVVALGLDGRSEYDLGVGPGSRPPPPARRHNSSVSPVLPARTRRDPSGDLRPQGERRQSAPASSVDSSAGWLSRPKHSTDMPPISPSRWRRLRPMKPLAPVITTFKTYSTGTVGRARDEVLHERQAAAAGRSSPARPAARCCGNCSPPQARCGARPSRRTCRS